MAVILEDMVQISQDPWCAKIENPKRTVWDAKASLTSSEEQNVRVNVDDFVEWQRPEPNFGEKATSLRSVNSWAVEKCAKYQKSVCRESRIEPL